MNLSRRVERLERQLAPPPGPTSGQIWIWAAAEALTGEELKSLEECLLRKEDDPSCEDPPEIQALYRRIEFACEAMAFRKTGKSYAELRGEESARGKHL